MTPEMRRAIEWDCTRLINLYVMLNDAHRWEELVDLYTQDGIMTRPAAPDIVIEGRNAMLSALLSRPPRASQHICTNIIVDVIADNEARATSTILLFTGTSTGDGLPLLDAGPPKIGSYRDHIVRVADRWRFKERRGTLTFTSQP
jgi:SnoaL-like domain